MVFDKFTPQIVVPKTDGKRDGHAWYALPAEEVLAELDAFAETGLSGAEVERRQAEYGPNQLTEAPPVSFWRMLWDQFNNFVVIMLVVAAVISAFLGEFIDASAILAIVVLNSALGVFQERRAEQALAALRKLATPEAHVIRDGSRQVIPSQALVPGDLVLMESGNYVPADVRLLEAFNL
ncbi:MAG TPA: cation-transporting P-type ATPase, partial [Anaerolineales bacterium]